MPMPIASKVIGITSAGSGEVTQFVLVGLLAAEYACYCFTEFHLELRLSVLATVARFSSRPV